MTWIVNMEGESSSRFSFIDKFRPEYITTRVNTMRCFPGCFGGNHHEKTFCGAPLRIRVQRSLLEGRNLCLLGELVFLDVPEVPPSFTLQSSIQDYSQYESKGVILGVEVPSMRTDKDTCITFPPERKWSVPLDKMIVRSARDAVFRVYKVEDGIVQGFVDSPVFSVIPHQIFKSQQKAKANASGAEKAGRSTTVPSSNHGKKSSSKQSVDVQQQRPPRFQQQQPPPQQLQQPHQQQHQDQHFALPSKPLVPTLITSDIVTSTTFLMPSTPTVGLLFSPSSKSSSGNHAGTNHHHHHHQNNHHHNSSAFPFGDSEAWLASPKFSIAPYSDVTAFDTIASVGALPPTASSSSTTTTPASTFVPQNKKPRRLDQVQRRLSTERFNPVDRTAATDGELMNVLWKDWLPTEDELAPAPTSVYDTQKRESW